MMFTVLSILALSCSMLRLAKNNGYKSRLRGVMFKALKVQYVKRLMG